MPTPKQIIEKIYADISQGNVSSVLPVLDEHVAIYMPRSLPWESEFHGRDGFMSMLTRRFQLWEIYQKNALRYFTSEQDFNTGIIVTGEITGKLIITSDSITIPFVDQWLLTDGQVIEYKVFYWDIIELVQYVHQVSSDKRLPLNGVPYRGDHTQL